jgi:hypothetical protein
MRPSVHRMPANNRRRDVWESCATQAPDSTPCNGTRRHDHVPLLPLSGAHAHDCTGAPQRLRTLETEPIRPLSNHVGVILGFVELILEEPTEVFSARGTNAAERVSHAQRTRPVACNPETERIQREGDWLDAALPKRHDELL